MKARAYESLSGVNQTFEQMLRHLEKLERLGMLRRKFLNGWRNRAEELRAEMNRNLTGALNAREEREWARLGRRTRLPAGQRANASRKRKGRVVKSVMISPS
ncbi:MAG: hypothetical protein LAP21_03815 [Acidobacteriia bacterium]|nr:hypothetical protein [Terriglobia bacterium]